MPALVLGITLIAFGTSGLLDDTGAIDHPPWTVAVAAAIAAAATAVVHTIRQLLANRSNELREPRP